MNDVVAFSACSRAGAGHPCIWVVLAACLFLPTAASSAGEDWQYWSTWSAAHKLSEKSTVSALTEAYFRDDMSDDYVYDGYLTYSRGIGHGFGVLTEAYFEWAESGAREWTGTRSVVAGLTYSTDIPGVCQLKLQDRFFYRLNLDPQWDYHRPRITLTRDLGPVGLSISDEMRVDLSGDREHDFFRNRLFITVTRKLTDMLTLGVGYVRQSDKTDGDWASFNVLQTVVSLTF